MSLSDNVQSLKSSFSAQQSSAVWTSEEDVDSMRRRIRVSSAAVSAAPICSSGTGGTFSRVFDAVCFLFLEGLQLWSEAVEQLFLQFDLSISSRGSRRGLFCCPRETARESREWGRASRDSRRRSRDRDLDLDLDLGLRALKPGRLP